MELEQLSLMPEKVVYVPPATDALVNIKIKGETLYVVEPYKGYDKERTRGYRIIHPNLSGYPLIGMFKNAVTYMGCDIETGIRLFNHNYGDGHDHGEYERKETNEKLREFSHSTLLSSESKKRIRDSLNDKQFKLECALRIVKKLRAIASTPEAYRERINDILAYIGGVSDGREARPKHR